MCPLKGKVRLGNFSLSPLMSFILYNIIEDEDSVATPKEYKKQTKKRVCRWQKSQLPERNTDFCGPPFTISHDSVRDVAPLDYFKLLWDDDVMTMLVKQTNLYSV